MKMKIYTYRCSRGDCRHIEDKTGVNKSQIRCTKCGSTAIKIATKDA